MIDPVRSASASFRMHIAGPMWQHVQHHKNKALGRPWPAAPQQGPSDGPSLDLLDLATNEGASGLPVAGCRVDSAVQA